MTPVLFLLAGAVVALAAAFAGGAWWMWRHTEVAKMQLGSVLERNLEREADLIGEQTFRDGLVAALPPERTNGPARMYDWSVERPELMP